MSCFKDAYYIDPLERLIYRVLKDIEDIKENDCWFCDNSELIGKTKDGKCFITITKSNEDWRKYKQIIKYCPICGKRL